MKTHHSKGEYLAGRFSEVISTGTWIANTNFKRELEQVTWELAHKKVDDLNTIADLAQHIHYYIAGINEVFQGKELRIRDVTSFSFQALLNESAWQEFLNKFLADAAYFATAVSNLSDEELNAVFVHANYGTFERNIDAMIEHAYYHLGQIVLIRKLLNSKAN